MKGTTSRHIYKEWSYWPYPSYKFFTIDQVFCFLNCKAQQQLADLDQDYDSP